MPAAALFRWTCVSPSGWRVLCPGFTASDILFLPPLKTLCLFTPADVTMQGQNPYRSLHTWSEKVFLAVLAGKCCSSEGKTCPLFVSRWLTVEEETANTNGVKDIAAGEGRVLRFGGLWVFFPSRLMSWWNYLFNTAKRKAHVLWH